jgi:hypothetical protein
MAQIRRTTANKLFADDPSDLKAELESTTLTTLLLDSLADNYFWSAVL